MKLFQIFKRNLVMLGVNSNHRISKHLYNGNCFVTFFLCAWCIISTGLLIFYGADNFIEYVEPIYMLSTAIVISIATAYTFIKMNMLLEFIERFENIINSRMKNSASKALFEKTNQQAEKWSGIISLVASKIIPIGSVLPRFIGSFLVYFFTDKGNDAFELPVLMWFPFNWKNPLGFSVAVAVQSIIGVYALKFTSSLVLFAMEAYLFANAMIRDINRLLKNINKHAKDQGNHRRILKQISEFIQCHSDLKQLFNDISEWSQPLYMIQFLWSLICGSSALLMVQMEILHHETNTAMLTMLILEICYAFGLVCVSCEVGEQFSGSFNKISHVIDKLDWYFLPIKVQRMLPMVILIAQYPVVLKCFGSISCVRKAFKKVIKTAFSYFMMLREFNN